MHRDDSRGPKDRGLTRGFCPDPPPDPREVVVTCWTGDRIQVSDTLGLLVLDVRDDEVVLGLDDESDGTQPFDVE